MPGLGGVVVRGPSQIGASAFDGRCPRRVEIEGRRALALTEGRFRYCSSISSMKREGSLRFHWPKTPPGEGVAEDPLFFRPGQRDIEQAALLFQFLAGVPRAHLAGEQAVLQAYDVHNLNSRPLEAWTVIRETSVSSSSSWSASVSNATSTRKSPMVRRASSPGRPRAEKGSCLR